MILAGDIGGTNSRLAFFDVSNGHYSLVSASVFPSGEYSGLDKIVAEFIDTSSLRPSQACFGVAGPVQNGRVETTNLPWVVESRRLEDELHIKKALLINDLEASAWGVPTLSAQELVTLKPGASIAVGNQAIIAAGTGLGEAGMYWDGKQHNVFAGEGGHTDFAPRDEIQVEMYRYLKAHFGRVSYERIVCGPGLVNIFHFLRDTGHGTVPSWLEAEMLDSDPAAAISRAAMGGKCPMSEQALDIFVAVYGAEAGNFALKLKATGGLFIAGGIAPKILPKLTTPLFIDAFLDKGRMRSLMESIPIQVIINDKIALLGAARCAAVRLAA